MIVSRQKFALSLICQVVVLTSALVAKPIVLQNDIGRLSVNADGSMQLQATNPACPVWNLRPAELWKITVAKGTDPFHLSDGVTFVAGENRPKCSAIEGGAELVYDTIRHGNQTWDIGLTLQVKQVGDEFQFSARIENRTENWTVRDFKFPILFEIREKGADHKNLAALLPTSLGQRFESPAKFGKHRSFQYPSGNHATMQWCALDGKGAGLYLGCHDVDRKRKTFAIANMGDYYNFSLNNEPYCTPGKTWKSAPMVVMPYEGTWHVAARRYRKWVDTWMGFAPGLDWVTNANTGWFLCILKQQNGDLMYRYDELDKVADFADLWGLDVLGLFGWAEGGHDRSYPDYIPDEKMGGPEVLKKSIRRVQKRGKKVILYANGQLIDKATDFCRKHAKECATKRPDGTYNTQRYNKFKSTQDPTFLQACLATEIWYQRLLELGMQAQDLGADGILYDQLGVMPAASCYCDSHGHATPAAPWAECRFQMTERLTKALRKRDPNFLVMTEGVIDSELGDFPYFHGCGTGTYPFLPGRNVFPEMFRYTFPEFITTQRNPNPMITRNIANQAFCYGMRHEIESRYVADVRYLEGKKVKPADYSDCNSPPYLHVVCSTPLETSSKYLRELIALENRFADFFKRGRFIDTEGIRFQGKDCVAKGFQATDGRCGVVVWNYGGQPQKVTLSVDGFQLEDAHEPEASAAVDPEEPIPAKTVRFYVWRKK